MTSVVARRGRLPRVAVYEIRHSCESCHVKLCGVCDHAPQTTLWSLLTGDWDLRSTMGVTVPFA